MSVSVDADLVEVEFTQISLSEYAQNLRRDGYHREAVRHEAQRLLNRLSVLADRPDLDGQALVQHALADKSPVLALNTRATPIERDEHAALRHLLLGVTCGVRNVLSHDVEREVPLRDGIVWLGLIGWLHERLDELEQLEPDADA